MTVLVCCQHGEYTQLECIKTADISESWLAAPHAAMTGLLALAPCAVLGCCVSWAELTDRFTGRHASDARCLESCRLLSCGGLLPSAPLQALVSYRACPAYCMRGHAGGRGKCSLLLVVRRDQVLVVSGYGNANTMSEFVYPMIRLGNECVRSRWYLWQVCIEALHMSCMITQVVSQYRRSCCLWLAEAQCGW